MEISKPVQEINVMGLDVNIYFACCSTNPMPAGSKLGREGLACVDLITGVRWSPV
jgi:hypothetical protein